MSDESFSLDEIRSQLASLGYGGISDARLNQFQSDLSKLLSDRLTDTNSFTESAPSSKPPSDSVIVRDIATGDESSFFERTDFTEYNDLPQIKAINSSDPNLDQPDLDQPDEATLVDNTDINSETEQPADNFSSSFNRMKRKVLRMQNGRKYVSVESSISLGESMISIEPHDRSETESLCSISTIDSDLRERLKKLKINISNKRSEPIAQSKKVNRVRFEPSAASLRSDFENIPPSRPKRPSTAPSGLRFWDGEHGSSAPAFLKPELKVNNKRGPVELYHKYKEDWDRFNYPSGKWDRHRMEVRKAMQSRDPEPVKPGRRITTDYVVPTTKKRQALAWEVRTALHEKRPISANFKHF